MIRSINTLRSTVLHFKQMGWNVEHLIDSKRQVALLICWRDDQSIQLEVAMTLNDDIRRIIYGKLSA